MKGHKAAKAVGRQGRKRLRRQLSNQRTTPNGKEGNSAATGKHKTGKPDHDQHDQQGKKRRGSFHLPRLYSSKHKPDHDHDHDHDAQWAEDEGDFPQSTPGETNPSAGAGAGAEDEGDGAEHSPQMPSPVPSQEDEGRQGGKKEGGGEGQGGSLSNEEEEGGQSDQSAKGVDKRDDERDDGDDDARGKPVEEGGGEGRNGADKPTGSGRPQRKSQNRQPRTQGRAQESHARPEEGRRDQRKPGDHSEALKRARPPANNPKARGGGGGGSRGGARPEPGARGRGRAGAQGGGRGRGGGRGGRGSQAASGAAGHDAAKANGKAAKEEPNDGGEGQEEAGSSHKRSEERGGAEAVQANGIDSLGAAGDNEDGGGVGEGVGGGEDGSGGGGGGGEDGSGGGGGGGEDGGDKEDAEAEKRKAEIRARLQATRAEQQAAQEKKKQLNERVKKEREKRASVQVESDLDKYEHQLESLMAGHVGWKGQPAANNGKGKGKGEEGGGEQGSSGASNAQGESGPGNGEQERKGDAGVPLQQHQRPGERKKGEAESEAGAARSARQQQQLHSELRGIELQLQESLHQRERKANRRHSTDCRQSGVRRVASGDQEEAHVVAQVRRSESLGSVSRPSGAGFARASNGGVSGPGKNRHDERDGLPPAAVNASPSPPPPPPPAEPAPARTPEPAPAPSQAVGSAKPEVKSEQWDALEKEMQDMLAELGGNHGDNKPNQQQQQPPQPQQQQPRQPQPHPYPQPQSQRQDDARALQQRMAQLEQENARLRALVSAQPNNNNAAGEGQPVRGRDSELMAVITAQNAEIEELTRQQLVLAKDLATALDRLKQLQLPPSNKQSHGMSSALHSESYGNASMSWGEGSHADDADKPVEVVVHVACETICPNAAPAHAVDDNGMLVSFWELLACLKSQPRNTVVLVRSPHLSSIEFVFSLLRDEGFGEFVAVAPDESAMVWTLSHGTGGVPVLYAGRGAGLEMADMDIDKLFDVSDMSELCAAVFFGHHSLRIVAVHDYHTSATPALVVDWSRNVCQVVFEAFTLRPPPYRSLRVCDAERETVHLATQWPQLREAVCDNPTHPRILSLSPLPPASQPNGGLCDRDYFVRIVQCVLDNALTASAHDGLSQPNARPPVPRAKLERKLALIANRRYFLSLRSAFSAWSRFASDEVQREFTDQLTFYKEKAMQFESAASALNLAVPEKPKSRSVSPDLAPPSPFAAMNRRPRSFQIPKTQVPGNLIDHLRQQANPPAAAAHAPSAGEGDVVGELRGQRKPSTRPKKLSRSSTSPAEDMDAAKEARERKRSSSGPEPTYEQYAAMASLQAPPPSLPPVPSSIVVCVRCRPLSRREHTSKHKHIMYGEEGRALTVKVREAMGDQLDYLASKRVQDRHFVFDRVYDGFQCGQEVVYNGVVRDLITHVIRGENATVFAYGATGSGKTHTMLGTAEDPGVIALAMRDLCAELRDVAHATLSVSFLEVYCERVMDLLSPQPTPPILEVREGKQGVVVSGLTHLPVTSAAEVIGMLDRGNSRRTTRSTNSNETSSRSHAVFQITVHRAFTTGRRSSVLSMVDLAGSERLKKSEVEGLGAVEATLINKSLLVLGNCITKLASGKEAHIPFRDSKLTRLLQPSLTGECRTVMIATVSPSHVQFEESLNTLKYANRAKDIKTLVRGS